MHKKSCKKLTHSEPSSSTLEQRCPNGWPDMARLGMVWLAKQVRQVVPCHLVGSAVVLTSRVVSVQARLARWARVGMFSPSRNGRGIRRRLHRRCRSPGWAVSGTMPCVSGRADPLGRDRNPSMTRCIGRGRHGDWVGLA